MAGYDIMSVALIVFFAGYGAVRMGYDLAAWRNNRRAAALWAAYDRRTKK